MRCLIYWNGLEPLWLYQREPEEYMNVYFEGSDCSPEFLKTGNSWNDFNVLDSHNNRSIYCINGGEHEKIQMTQFLREILGLK